MPRSKATQKKEMAPSHGAPNAAAESGPGGPGPAAMAASDGQTSRSTLLLGAIVVVVLMGAALWQMGGTGPKPGGEIPAANRTAISVADQPQARLLMEMVGRTQKIPGVYEVRYNERTEEGETVLTIRSDGRALEARMDTPFFARTYAWAGNQTILCEKGRGAPVCGRLNESSGKWAEAARLQGMSLPLPNETAAIVRAYRRLFDENGFEFVGNATSRSVAGRACREMRYRVGGSDIAVCLDEQYGVVLRQRMTYEQPYRSAGSNQISYRKANYSLEASALIWSADPIQIPAVEDGTRAAGLAARDDEEWADLSVCLKMRNESEQRTCLKNNAIGYNDVRFCEQAQNESVRGDCIIKVATQPSQFQPELCGLAGGMKSECYANIAYLKKDLSYCGLVEDAGLRQRCLDEVGKMTEPARNATNATTNPQVVGASQK